jgi:predicted TPR repeat methyltransferase
MTTPDTPAADSAPEALLARAMSAHEAGRLDEAEALYRQVLTADVDHPDALHLYGLLCLGRRQHKAALKLIERAVELRPLEAMFLNNLGNLLQTMGRLEDAVPAYMRAIEAEPERVESYNNAAMLLAKLGDMASAAQVLEQLVAVAPGFTDARQNLAAVYLHQGKYNEAIAECRAGLITNPAERGLRRLLGMAYSTLGQNELAIEVYRHWLADEPGRAEAVHHLAALTGEAVPERASDEYVRRAFEGFATSFDAKLAQLGYKAPELVAAVVQRRRAGAARSLRFGDAGCGTGLCAPLVAPFARSIVGVDLSPAMLEQAARRGGYDELVEAELVAFLQARPAAFDVLISADTLCYFGRVDEFAAAARASLAPGGLLVFTVEAHADAPGAPDFRLQHHGRYSHRLGYVEQALRAAGFGNVAAENVVLRSEHLQPVHGWLVEADLEANHG